MSAKLVTIVRAMIPKISSIMAAPRIAFPDLVFNLPNSFKVSTVIPVSYTHLDVYKRQGY